MIYVLDFGSQYSHLITRRIRELGVYAELVPHNFALDKLRTAKGIILSGGPQNLSEKGALRISKAIFSLGVPVLGICYGMQLTAFELGGQVQAGKRREYGPTNVLLRKSAIFQNLKPKQSVWMSHGDQVTKLPHGFSIVASSRNCAVAAMANGAQRIYGLQFHPEVAHTKNGMTMLKNFLKLTGAKKSWSMKNFLQDEIVKIKKQVGHGKAVCALSGGIDSAVAAAIIHKAVGRNLVCIYVDTGLMREGETEQIIKTFKQYQKIDLRIIKAKREFLAKLKSITDPEKKRKIIGELFIRIF